MVHPTLFVDLHVRHERDSISHLPAGLEIERAAIERASRSPCSITIASNVKSSGSSCSRRRVDIAQLYPNDRTSLNQASSRHEGLDGRGAGTCGI